LPGQDEQIKSKKTEHNVLMKFKQCLTIIFFLLTTHVVYGQAIRSFTPDSVIFIDELTSYFQRTPLKEKQEEALLTLDAFHQLWMAEAFATEDKKEIYDLANLMLSKRVSPNPGFEMFLRTLILLKNKNTEDAQLRIWMAGVKQTLEETRGTRDFSALMEFSVSLLEDNVLYRSRIFSWHAGTQNYEFSSGPAFYVTFGDMSLTCRTKSDSTIIYNTSGTYDPLTMDWQGNSGKITWTRAGLDPDHVYARFGEFSISLKTSTFTIDQVNFYHLSYFPDPLPGSVTEKVSTNIVTAQNANYPYFKADERRLQISGIFRDVDYEGGFSMKGADILGEGDEFSLSRLTFTRPYRDRNGNYDLLIARSKAFIIKPGLIMASDARVTIYHQQDSIFHTGLQLKYTHKNREVSLIRENKGLMESLYLDTFHNVDIDCEAVYWKMDEPEIRFRSIMGIQPESEALFISDKYFIEQQYNVLQGLDRIHPLIVINNYSKKYNTDRFFAYDLAQYMKMPENTVERQLIRLAKYGFIFYNTETRQAIISEKLDHYIDAKNGRADYDVISFFSRVENQDNAVLSLDNFDLKIRGVPRIFISDSQQVYIYPAREEVILRKNRDFLFSGKIQVGLFEFQATDCTFEYDTFKLNFPNIDQMKFKVRAFDDTQGQMNFVDVKTVISDISGELFIDHPSNKNSLRNYPDYPIFNSTTDSYVYYNQDSIHNNAYDPETFNYNLQPFTIKRLADVSNNNLQFGGFLNSAGIFPPEVNMPLRVMPDYSLGFQIVSPPGGYPIYGGKGTFFDTIVLSNAGLKGSGKLEYLNITANGRDILLYPDSAIGTFDEFSIAKKTAPAPGFPSLSGKNLNQRWLPYRDSMMLATTDSSLMLFDNRASLEGELLFTPEQLTGSGKLDFYTAQARSDQYEFGAGFFSSDSLNLTIKNLNEESIVFSADQFSAYVDMDQQTGNFKSVSGNPVVELPLNRYSASMDEFDWYINRSEIELKSTAVNSDVNIATLSQRELMEATPNGGLFTSLHPLQDSLWFYATEAAFNISDTTLVAKDVKVIKVADAAIFPGNGIVEIKNNAALSPLTNAMIIADTLNKIHLITNALVDIESRYSYKAAGYYAYKNLVDETQIIEFDQIEVDTGYQTIAAGKITPEQSFMFSPQFTYQGDVSLNAGHPQLFFEGAYKIIQDCDPNLSRWVSFRERITPDSLAFPVSPEPQEFAQKKLYTGFFHSNEENRVYPAFLSRKSYYSDTLMMSVDGIITTRKKGSEFLISAPQDAGIAENKYPSWPFMSLNTNECKIIASGEINFGTDLGKVEMKAFGQTEHYTIPDSTTFNAFITLDFFFSEDALKYMAMSLKAANTAGVETSGPVSEIAYNLLLGEEGAKDLIFDLNSFGTVRNIPDELNKTLIISEVRLVYHPETRSFVSEGQIGVGMVGEQTVNKYFDGHMEIVRKRSGDIIQIYLEIDRRHWYFFNHTGNLMQTISSENDYNRIITDEDAGDRMDKKEKGEATYRYIISTTQKKNRFLRAIRALKSDLEEE
jgi:hypothetical protein